jgi:hypothetical protein
MSANDYTRGGWKRDVDKMSANDYTRGGWKRSSKLTAEDVDDLCTRLTAGDDEAVKGVPISAIVALCEDITE